MRTALLAPTVGSCTWVPQDTRLTHRCRPKLASHGHPRVVTHSGELLDALHGPSLGLDPLGRVPDPSKSGACCGPPETSPPRRQFAEMDSPAASRRLAVLGRTPGVPGRRLERPQPHYLEHSPLEGVFSGRFSAVAVLPRATPPRCPSDPLGLPGATQGVLCTPFTSQPITRRGVEVGCSELGTLPRDFPTSVTLHSRVL